MGMFLTLFEIEGVHESNSLVMESGIGALYNVIQFEFSNSKTTKPLMNDKASCILCHSVVKGIGLCQDYSAVYKGH